jgi:hypothetical protein
MRGVCRAGVLVGVLAFFLANAGRSNTVAPPAEARALLQRALGYPAWPTLEARGEPRPSSAHGRMHVVTHYNSVAGEALRAGTRPLPEGSILVAEHRRDPRARPSKLTVMAKERGAWYWLASTPDGKVFLAAGAPQAGPRWRPAPRATRRRPATTASWPADGPGEGAARRRYFTISFTHHSTQACSPAVSWGASW